MEAALLDHPGVLDAVVFGVPDALRGEIVAAAVIPTARYQGTNELAADIQGFVRATLGKYLYPRQVMFVEALPRTESGKVQRSLLRQRFISAQEAGATFGTMPSDT